MGTLGGVGVCVRDIPLVPHRGNHYLCLNHFIFPMDILKKELTSIYARQNLSSEHLSTLVVDECRHIVETSAAVEDDCRVITDAATDTCHIFGGAFARLIGMESDRIPFSIHADSGDEDIIYTRIHPEDLVDKRMLEYEFFKLVDKMPSETKCDFRACCRIRIKGCGERYIFADNTTRILRLSPAGMIWLILCTYNLSPCQSHGVGINPVIIDIASGDVAEVALSKKRDQILTPREKEILSLIRDGYPSKIIADRLCISIHTVNRHRQNILEKLSVGNSLEAIMAASAMRLM